MQTSYFANLRNIPPGQRIVVIALYFPQWMPVAMRSSYEHAVELAPTTEMLAQGRYRQDVYLALLASERGLTAQGIWERYGDAILICHEANQMSCHRRMLATWLEESLHVVIQESPRNVRGATQKDEQLSFL